jgi:hypothetical protein
MSEQPEVCRRCGEPVIERESAAVWIGRLDRPGMRELTMREERAGRFCQPCGDRVWVAVRDAFEAARAGG